MFIAIPTDDRSTIAKKSGRAKEFAIFDLESGKVVFKENPHKHHDHSEGHHEHSHKDMIDMFKEFNVKALIVDVVGKHFKGDLSNAEIDIFKTELKPLDEIFLAFKSGKDGFKKIGE